MFYILIVSRYSSDVTTHDITDSYDSEKAARDDLIETGWKTTDGIVYTKRHLLEGITRQASIKKSMDLKTLTKAFDP